ncbi:reverse transcriptase SR3 [Labeo rohita]|uniref:Reverse transcriptase SR3 n=1 Tax=Labeo rohita TaxID=84645 RepID=A0A498MCT0_LABRO|nr:reverse transcriptase SR3 [Labeo rohita]
MSREESEDTGYVRRDVKEAVWSYLPGLPDDLLTTMLDELGVESIEDLTLVEERDLVKPIQRLVTVNMELVSAPDPSAPSSPTPSSPNTTFQSPNQLLPSPPSTAPSTSSTSPPGVPWHVDFRLNWDQVSSAIRLRVEKEERPLPDERKAFVIVLVDQMMQHDRNPTRAMCHSVDVDVLQKLQEAISRRGQTILDYCATLDNPKIRNVLACYDPDSDKAGCILLLLMLYFKEPKESLMLEVDPCATAVDVNTAELPSTPCLIIQGDMMKPSGWLLSIEGHVVMGPHPFFLHGVAAFFSSNYVFNLEYPAAGSSTLEFIQRPAPLTRDKIRKAITLMKNGKAAGPDDIPAEALKANLNVSVEMIFPLFERIWEFYNIPTKMVNLIKNSYNGMSCRVIHGGQLTNSFQVRTGVRQGCLLSQFLFLLAMDCIMRSSTSRHKNSIQWALWKQLDDLEFADDLALLSYSQQQMQVKINIVAFMSSQVGLNIHKDRTKILKVNTTSTEPITLHGIPLKEVQFFIYLGSIIDQQSGTDAVVQARIGLDRACLVQTTNTNHQAHTEVEPSGTAEERLSKKNLAM